MLKILLICFYFNNVSAWPSIRNWGKDADCVGDELNGTCVEPHRCFSTNPYIDGLKYPKACTLKDDQVGVCCTDCQLVNNSSDYHLDHAEEILWEKTGQKSWDKCLEYIQRYKYFGCYSYGTATRNKDFKICHMYDYSHVYLAVGGRDSTRGKYSHMALLGYEGTTTPDQWRCSGSLISERFILTAAHCLDNRELGPVTQAAFGLLKRSDPAENWHKYNIKRAVPHPNYEPPSTYDDIALLETEIPVVFTKQLILPACLPAIELDNESNYSITATGWGRLGYTEKLADTLQEVDLEMFSDEKCDELYPVHRRHRPDGINSTTQMCYGHRTLIRDTCQGDSGGPLQVLNGSVACISTLIGVTSHGGACGFEGGAGVYINITSYLPWIESVVWPDPTPGGVQT